MLAGMRFIGTLIATVAVLAFSASAAEASRLPIGVVIAQATRYADSWWSEQGSIPPCAFQADAKYADLGTAIAAESALDSCTVTWNTRFTTEAAGVLAAHDLSFRREALRAICTFAIHERGHDIGYSHTNDGGVMDPNPTTPGGCVRWAARMLPARHHHRR